MKGDVRVLAALNEALRAELTAINQYILHGEMQSNWGYEALATASRQRAISEMKHAEAVVERLLFLEGAPDMVTLAINVGTNAQAQLQSDMALEVGGIALYRTGALLAREVGDGATAVLFERHLVDEEAHLNDMEAHAFEIAELGYVPWLSEQMK